MHTKSLTFVALSLVALGACSSPPPIDYAAEVAALAEEAWQHQVAGNAYLQVRQGGLRQRGREQAGERFDIRDLHDAVLGSGPMPMTVLEDHLEWYFDRQLEDSAAQAKG